MSHILRKKCAHYLHQFLCHRYHRHYKILTVYFQSYNFSYFLNTKTYLRWITQPLKPYINTKYIGRVPYFSYFTTGLFVSYYKYGNYCRNLSLTTLQLSPIGYYINFVDRKNFPICLSEVCLWSLLLSSVTLYIIITPWWLSGKSSSFLIFKDSYPARTWVQILLGTFKYNEEIVTEKLLYPPRIYLIHSCGAHSAANDALMRRVRCIGLKLKHAIAHKNLSEFRHVICYIFYMFSELCPICKDN